MLKRSEGKKLELTSTSRYADGIPAYEPVRATMPRIAKRAADVAASLIGLVLLAPVFAIVVAVVHAHGDGAAVWRKPRVGINGRRFDGLFFRTGRNHGDAPRRRRTDRAPCRSTIGDLLHYTGVDALPQLVNVLRGDMSIVGPRPLTKEELDRHGSDALWYASVRPGMTGPWQILHDRRITPEARVAIDADYVARWTLAHDLSILLRTPHAVLRRRGGIR